MRIALAGNPNSGKTTLYNAITGKNEFIGNWPGVTVEKKEADLKRSYEVTPDLEVRIVDLPGAYSIAPFTGEEAITREFVMNESPDVIINIVDAANVSRSLFFTTQLLELGIPVTIALNKSDIADKRGDVIDVEKLSKILHCKVIHTEATTGKGLKELVLAAIETGTDGHIQESPGIDVIDATTADITRQRFVDQVIRQCQKKGTDTSKVSVSDRIDRIVAHKWLGLPIFFLVMWGVFTLSIEGLGGYLSGYFNDVVFGEVIPTAANGFFESIHVHPLMQALIVDGVIGGIGAVVGFLPLIMVLFFFLSLLEDSGYMARVAIVMDRYFKKIGLSGKSIIPMIVGSGCAIPGIMATRTIEDINEKRMTTILTPFVPCGAKLPIIGLFAAAFFPNDTWVGPSMYILAVGMIVLGGLMLKRIFVWENTSHFIMELPEYKFPSLKHAFLQMIDKAKAFIYKATTIILVCNTFIWFAQAYSWTLQPVDDQGASILASLGSVIAPILIPLGLVGWQMAASTLTGFIAKENVVATLAVILAVTSEEALHVPGGPLVAFFNPVTAYAFLAFNLFTPPCFAAIGAMNSEMGSPKWLWRGLAFQFGMGYTLAMLITQLGSLIVYQAPATGWQSAIVVFVCIVAYIAYAMKRTKAIREREVCTE